MIRVLVTGCKGQVGAEVARRLAGRAEVIAHDRASLDLASPGDIAARVREARPQVIVNAAAYTAVDRAESEPELAHAINAVAPGLLAAEANRSGALLVHYSTDYVFDGTQSSPYAESDPTRPLGEYGRSKRAGEQAIAASGAAHVILRTSWVYGPRGKNFLLTMLNAAKTRDELRVVDDQFGAPTSSLQLARATVALFAGLEARALGDADVARVASAPGIYHATASGRVSWHGFAAAIFERWPRHAKSPPRIPRVTAIPSSEYPTPVRRPANSCLDNAKLFATFNVALDSWESGLDEVLRELASTN